MQLQSLFTTVKKDHSNYGLFMVGDEVSSWNPFLDSLLHLAEQLEELSIVYAGGQAVYIEPAEVDHA